MDPWPSSAGDNTSVLDVESSRCCCCQVPIDSDIRSSTGVADEFEEDDTDLAGPHD